MVCYGRLLLYLTCHQDWLIVVGLHTRESCRLEFYCMVERARNSSGGPRHDLVRVIMYAWGDWPWREEGERR